MPKKGPLFNSIMIKIMLLSTIFLCCLLCIIAYILESLRVKLFLVSKLGLTKTFLSSPLVKFFMCS